MADVYTEAKEKRKRRRIYFWSFSIFLLAYLMFLGGSWIVFRSPLFRLKQFIVTGNSQVSTEDITGLLEGRALQGQWRPLKALLGLHSMLIWPDAFSQDDLAFLPSVKSITLTKNYADRTITVKVVERKPFGIWCAAENTSDTGFLRCLWFDDEGVLFERAVAAEGGLIMTVHDSSQKGLGLRSNILPAEFIPTMFSIFKVLGESGLNMKEIQLKDLALEEIEVTTFDGPTLYFSLRFPAVNDLVAIQNLSAKPGFGKLQYLDFRVENRVYYK